MGLKSSTQTYGQLRCRVVDALPPGKSPGLLIVLNHGFGASGDDLVDFGPMLIESSEAISDRCRFVFPAAPIDLASQGMPGGRAWWPINMARLAEMNQTRDFDQLTQLEPPGMKDATGMLLAAIEAALSDAGLSDSGLILGGFSQGAMVSTCATLTKPLVPALLALFSGTLLDRDHWRELATRHPGCPVLQSHGRQDPILPFAPAVLLKDMLAENGFAVEFMEFNGPHTIPITVLERLRAEIEERIPRD